MEPDEDLLSRARDWLEGQPANDFIKVTKSLTSVFPYGSHLSSDKIDIIISVPPIVKTMKFACYFLAEKPSFLVVNISSDAYVSELLEAICAEIEFADKKANVDDLHFFKASLFFI